MIDFYFYYLFEHNLKKNQLPHILGLTTLLIKVSIIGFAAVIKIPSGIIYILIFRLTSRIFYLSLFTIDSLTDSGSP